MRHAIGFMLLGAMLAACAWGPDWLTLALVVGAIALGINSASGYLYRKYLERNGIYRVIVCADTRESLLDALAETWEELGGG